MNLISSIFVKDYDIKRSAGKDKRSSMREDHGYNVYKTLEFGKDYSTKVNHNPYLERICNKLV